MVVLKKIKGSTLMETLVATVLIMVIFMLASMILNNLFSNTIKNNTRAIEARLNELQYLYAHDKLEIPYYDDQDHWNISIEEMKQSRSQKKIMFKANNGTKHIEIESYSNEN